MKMKTKSKKGLTLIELMSAVATGTFVILAAGMVLTFGQQSWNNEWKRTALQREAAYLMVAITQPLKSATFAIIDDANNTAIRMNTTDGDNIRFGQVPGETILRKNINDGTNLDISTKLQNLTFTVSGKTVTTSLTVEVDNIQASSVSTVMMRNYGG